MVITVKKVTEERINVDKVLAVLKSSVSGAKYTDNENVIIKRETLESTIIIQKLKEDVEKTNCSCVHHAMIEDFLRSSFL